MVVFDLGCNSRSSLLDVCLHVYEYVHVLLIMPAYVCMHMSAVCVHTDISIGRLCVCACVQYVLTDICVC